MSDDDAKKPEPAKRPDPVEDLKTGLGLLFRAAKTAVDEFPSDRLEEAVKTGAREVSRAIETVTGAIEQEVLGRKKSSPPPGAGSGPAANPPAAAPPAEPPAAASPSTSSKPDD
jgi:hypothetical protein